MTNTKYKNLKVVALAGGVGGSKMVNGLAQILPADNLFIIANTGDDFEHLGLSISPDLDTIMYTLAGINNPKTGSGVAGLPRSGRRAGAAGGTRRTPARSGCGPP